MTTQRTMRTLLLEGAVIVGSILLAFAIDAWWDGRREAARRVEVLEGLRADFTATSGLLREAISWGDTVLARGDRVLAAGAGGPSLPRDSSRLLITSAFNGIGFTPSLPNYEAAIASGGIATVRSDSLLVRLNRFEAGKERFEEGSGLLGQMLFLGPIQSVVADAGGMLALADSENVNGYVARADFRAGLASFRDMQNSMVLGLRAMRDASDAILREIERLARAR